MGTRARIEVGDEARGPNLGRNLSMTPEIEFLLYEMDGKLEEVLIQLEE
jgi:hypothetical protein